MKKVTTLISHSYWIICRSGWKAAGDGVVDIRKSGSLSIVDTSHSSLVDLTSSSSKPETACVLTLSVGNDQKVEIGTESKSVTYTSCSCRGDGVHSKRSRECRHCQLVSLFPFLASLSKKITPTGMAVALGGFSCWDCRSGVFKDTFASTHELR
ncbi:hypothetical protein BLNAU_7541 [Blattamonas nauphoetae]|uniref:Uncharacterized protein n=1 Tax=Blattamonas nauphoetae TaxID=2049346 RepID=A0ABQ9Y0X2_9EUKA|nr:hypothetical protein BLNAU_7541 [Blattamonas nauphoetae]